MDLSGVDIQEIMAILDHPEILNEPDQTFQERYPIFSSHFCRSEVEPVEEENPLDEDFLIQFSEFSI